MFAWVDCEETHISSFQLRISVAVMPAKADPGIVVKLAFSFAGLQSRSLFIVIFSVRDPAMKMRTIRN